MKVLTVKLSDIKHVENTRGEDLEVAGLMQSIKKHGLFQPICLAKNFTKSNHKYVLAAGNRRFEAVRKLGTKEILAVVNPDIKDMKDLMIVNLSENIQREDVSAYEQGRFIHKLIDEYEMTIGECAARLGTTPKLVSSFKSAYDTTPELFRQKVRYTKRTNKNEKGHIPIGVAVAINNAQKEGHINHKQMVSLYKKSDAGIYTKKNVDDCIKKLKEGKKFSDVVDAAKITTNYTLSLTMYNMDRDKLIKSEGSVKNAIEKIVFGETMKKIRRPRL